MRRKAKIFLVLLVIALVLSGCGHFYQDLKDLGQGEEFQISSAFEIVDGKTAVLIGFKERPGKAELDQVKGLGGEVTRSFNIVNALAANIPAVAIEKLKANPNILYVEPDVEVFALGQTVPWGIDRVFGPENYKFDTWEITKGAIIAVAILDTGIDQNHEDLPGLKGGTNTVDSTPWGSDGSGHGTHVAGTVAALDNNIGVVGVGPEIGLFAVKVLSDSGSGTVSSVVAGIDWAVEQKILILNMSLGSSTHSQTLKDACDAAYTKGHLIIASAGNNGNPSGRGDNVGFPAAYDSVIAVAASANNDRRASFSSTGPAVELIAPGASILSTVPGNSYGTKSGTSMASPHVTGVAALVWSLDKNLTNVQVRGILRDTAEDLGISSTQQGYGLVRADLAVRAVQGEEPPIIETYSVSGKVMDSSQFPLEGALVEIEGTSRSSISGQDGSYIIEEVPKGTYNITASKEGYKTVSKKDIVVDSNIVELNFYLEKVEDGNGNGDEGPVIVEFKMTDTSNPAWARVTVNWVVASDGNLASVKSEMILDGAVVDSKTSSISGTQSNGTHELRNRGGQGKVYSIRLTVTDTSGKVATETKEISL